VNSVAKPSNQRRASNGGDSNAPQRHLGRHSNMMVLDVERVLTREPKVLEPSRTKSAWPKAPTPISTVPHTNSKNERHAPAADALPPKSR
jgi:hypothetical protein